MLKSFHYPKKCKQELDNEQFNSKSSNEKTGVEKEKGRLDSKKDMRINRTKTEKRKY